MWIKMYPIAIAILTCFAAIQAKEKCIKGPSYLYSGSHSTTKSGISCQRWDANKPHEASRIPEDGGHHNHCRNPDKDSRGVWCYTTDPKVRWEYCGIPKCDESANVVWTSYDENKNVAFIESVKADPEFVSENQKTTGSEPKKAFAKSQLGAIGVGKNGKEIFFVDIRKNYLGAFNTKTSKVEKYLKGKASDVYAISQDWDTGNIYFTDTKSKRVMVANRKFESTMSVHDTAPSEPRAIIVIPNQGKLVFSTYIKLNTKIRGAEIVVTDLAGKNPKVLLKSPEIIEVTGLAVDGERIYWTDNLGYASRIMSSRLDGSKKTEHYFKKSALFQDISVYSEYIYVTDAQIRYNYFDHIRYHINVIRKDSDQVYSYTKPDQPHGIAVLRKVEAIELGKGAPMKCLDNCNGICLSDSKGRYKCNKARNPQRSSLNRLHKN